MHGGDADYLSWQEPISFCFNSEGNQLEWPTARAPIGTVQPPEIRPILPLLAMKYSRWLASREKQDVLMEFESDYLASTCVTDRSNGIIRLPSVQLILQWLGWSEQAYELVASAKPCINKATCGLLENGWCPVCGEIIAKFGDSWNHRTMTAVIVQVLREHAVAHRFKVNDTHWEWNRNPHECGSKCRKH